jgi:hypothetical protein
VTQRVAQLAHPGPHRGGLTSSSFVYEFRSGGFFTPLYVDWHLVIRVLPIGIIREHRIKPHGSHKTIFSASEDEGKADFTSSNTSTQRDDKMVWTPLSLSPCLYPLNF